MRKKDTIDGRDSRKRRLIEGAVDTGIRDSTQTVGTRDGQYNRQSKDY